MLPFYPRSSNSIRKPKNQGNAHGYDAFRVTDVTRKGRVVLDLQTGGWTFCDLARLVFTTYLGGGLKYFLFSPRILGEDEPILTNIFEMA